mgnify:CR=1 FL=1
MFARIVRFLVVAAALSLPIVAVADAPQVSSDVLPATSSQPVCIARGRTALNVAGFQGVGSSGVIAYGHLGEFTAVVHCSAAGQNFAIVAGPDGTTGSNFLALIQRSF